MSSKKHQQDMPGKSPRTSPRFKMSPKTNRLYPDLVDEMDDETDESWTMPSPGEGTLSSTMSSDDYVDSSFLDSSPAGRRPIHEQDSSFTFPHTRSGKCYKPSSLSGSSSETQDSFTERQKQYKRPKPTPPENQTVTTFVLFLVIVCVTILTCGVYYVYYSGCNQEVGNPEQPKLYEQFKFQMTDLRKKFPSQSSKSWKSLHIATKHILIDPQPVYPAVILMVGPSDSLKTMSCIGSQMVSMLNQLYNVSATMKDKTQIYVSELNHHSADIEKEDLDNRLHKVFSDGSKGAMLVNIETLSPQAALMLHSYCDNDHAPFRNVLLILQLVTDELSSDGYENQAAVEKFLRDIWERDLGIDRIMALFSRIANNVVPIRAENPVTMREICD